MQVKAYLRKASRRGTSSINIWYTHKTKYIAFKTGLKIEPDKWDQGRGLVKPQFPEALTSNLLIEKQKADLMERARMLLLSGHNPSIDAIRDSFKKGFTAPLPEPEPVKLVPQVVEAVVEHKAATSKADFLMLLDRYQEANRDHIAAGTYKQRKAFTTSIKELAIAKNYTFQFSKLDADSYSILAKYYLYDKGFYNNFFGSIIKRFKGFLKWCEEERGIAINPAWRKFKIYTEEKEIVYLNPAEVDRLYAADWESFDKRCVDLFVLACDTGFRVSDLFRSKVWHIDNGMIYTTTKKTKGAAKVPVTPRIKEILERWNYDMKILSEQKVNEKIKLLLEKLEMTEPVSYYRYKLREEFEFTERKCDMVTIHCGRRSFVSNCFAKGYNESEIMEMLGSKDAKTFAKYLKIESSNLKARMQP